MTCKECEYFKDDGCTQEYGDMSSPVCLMRNICSLLCTIRDNDDWDMEGDEWKFKDEENE